MVKNKTYKGYKIYMATLGDRRCELDGYSQTSIGHSKVQKRIHEIRTNLGPRNTFEVFLVCKTSFVFYQRYFVKLFNKMPFTMAWIHSLAEREQWYLPSF